MSGLYIDSLLCSDRSLLNKYRKPFTMLLAGQTKSLGLEKLKNSGKHPIYSIRLSDCARAILTVATIDGKKQWVLLSILEHHEYDREKTLAKGGLQAFFDKNSSWLADPGHALGLEDFEDCNEIPVEASAEPETIDFVPSYHYQGRFLKLSTQQESALTLQLPAMITGGAGAGKTLLGFLLWQQYLSANPSARILLVSPNEALAHIARVEFQNRFASDYPNAIFDSRTYAELAGIESPSKNEYAVFLEWVQAYRKKPAIKANLQTAELCKYPEEIFYEFRVLSGYEEAEYYQLGNRQASDADRRQWLWAAYQSYLDYLKEKKYCFSAHLDLDRRKPCDLLIIDEFQSYPFRNIRSLLGLSPNILVLGDPNQSIASLFSPWNYFKNYIYGRYKTAPAEVQLSQVHRCSRSITGLANQVLHARNRILEGLPEKIACSALEPTEREGQVFWTENCDDPQVLALRNQASLMVITSPELLAEARQKFSPATVLTADQCPGLEADTVIIYRILDNSPGMLRVSAALKGIENDRAFFHRSKASSSQQQIANARMLHQLFLITTRARTQFVLVQRWSAEYEHLFAALPGLNRDRTQLDLFTATMTADEMVEQLLRQGLTSDAIAKMHQLEYSEEKIAGVLALYGLSPVPTEQAKPRPSAPAAVKPEEPKAKGKKKKGKAPPVGKNAKGSPAGAATVQQLAKLKLLFNNFERNLTAFLRDPEAVRLLSLLYQGEPAIFYILKDPNLRASLTSRLVVSSPLPDGIKTSLLKFLLSPLNANNLKPISPIEILVTNPAHWESELTVALCRAALYDSVSHQSAAFTEVVSHFINREIVQVCKAGNDFKKLYFLLQRQVLPFTDSQLKELMSHLGKNSAILVNLYQAEYPQEVVDRLVYTLLYSLIKSIKPEDIVFKDVNNQASMGNMAETKETRENILLSSITRSIFKTHPRLLFLRPNQSESISYRLSSIGCISCVSYALNNQNLERYLTEACLTEKHGNLENLFVQLFYSDLGILMIMDLLSGRPEIRPFLEDLIRDAGISEGDCILAEQSLFWRKLTTDRNLEQFSAIETVAVQLGKLAETYAKGPPARLFDDNNWLSNMCEQDEAIFRSTFTPALTKYFLNKIPGDLQKKELGGYVDRLVFIVLRYLYTCYSPPEHRDIFIRNTSLSAIMTILYYSGQETPPFYSPVYKYPGRSADIGPTVMVVNDHLSWRVILEHPCLYVVFTNDEMRIFRSLDEMETIMNLSLEALTKQSIFHSFAYLVPTSSPDLVTEAHLVRSLQLELLQEVREIIRPTMDPQCTRNPLAMLEDDYPASPSLRQMRG